MKKVVVESKQEFDPASRVDEQICAPGKYEVTKEHVFRVDFYLAQEKDRWVVKGSATNKTEQHWVEFRVWTFAEEIELKKKSTSYDQSKRTHFIDHDLLNRLKVQKLLRAWSLEEENPNLKLHRVNDVLTDESYAAFSKLFPNIIRKILDGMNDVLECNG